MKGFVPFAGDWRAAFPHSLEWAAFPLNAIMNGPGRFDFERRVEETIAEIAGRGHQAILRVYLDYPGRPSGIPRFLVEAGLRMTRYEDHGGGLAPDYRNEDLLASLIDFIGAFGTRYDGDGRIACIALGLLGFRGAWRTRPLDGLMADPPTQRRIMAAYTKAFSRTRLLMPFPHDDAMRWPVGLHDDDFARHAGGLEESEFLRLIREAKAEDLWKRQPVGGKLWPEAQPFLWKEPDRRPPGWDRWDFGACVRSARASWLVNHGLFEAVLPDDEYQRALEGARLLGYELEILAVEMPARVKPGGALSLTFDIQNRGVAPLYADWKIFLRFESGDNEETESVEISGALGSILPDSAPRKWRAALRAPDPLPAGGFRIRLIPPRAFPDAPPLRFANAEAEADGSLALADYRSDGKLGESASPAEKGLAGRLAASSITA